MAEHSHVGASGMHRWAHCPGSVRLSRKAENTSSFYAAEGTVAHAIGERILKNEPHPVTGDVVEQDGFQIEVTDEMIEAVESYAGVVYDDMMPSDTLMVEHHFHLKDLHEGLFGTNDACLFSRQEKKLIVYDYKHGQGVPVEAKDNPQLLYYAVGALLESGFNAEAIECVIVQPRCNHPDGPVRRWTVDAAYLLDWVGDLLDAVARTEDPDAPLNPGDYCRFCPAAGFCPELREQALAAARVDFAPELAYDPDELATVLDKLDLIEGWVKSVREFAYREAMHGRVPPRWKLVKKRSNRQWIDDGAAEKALLDYGMDAADIHTKPKLKSPAQIEKVIGKANKDGIAHLIHRPDKGAKLVPESEPGEPVDTSPAADFAPV